MTLRLESNTASALLPCAPLCPPLSPRTPGPRLEPHRRRSDEPEKALSAPPGLGTVCGGAAYAVSLSGARLLAQVQTPVWMSADGVMDPRHLASVGKAARVFHSDPPLAYHDEPAPTTVLRNSRHEQRTRTDTRASAHAPHLDLSVRGLE